MKGRKTLNIKFNWIKIHHTSSPKFLGVHIDQSLIFRQQAEYMAGKAAKRNSVLRSLSGRKWDRRLGPCERCLVLTPRQQLTTASEHGEQWQ